MVRALFDTNILIDYLNGIEAARDEIGKYEEVAISIVTWMEVLIGASAEVEPATRRFLASFTLVPIDESVAERAVGLRRDLRCKLPDAVILASARANAMLLVTRNTKDFAADDPGVRVPYVL